MSLFVAVWLPVAAVGLLYPLQRNGFRSSGRQLQELVLPFAKGKRPCATGCMMSPATLWRGVALALGGVSTTPPHAHRWWVHTPAPLSPACTPGPHNHNGPSKNFEISKVFFII